MSWSNVGTSIVVVLLSYEVRLEMVSRVKVANCLPVFLNAHDFPLCGCM